MRAAGVFAFAAAAVANPLNTPIYNAGCGGYNPTIDSHAADKIAKNYALVIGPTYSDKLAQSFLSSSFVDYSDSINSLIGAPLGTATFPNRQAFMASQKQQQQASQLAPLNVKKTAYGKATVTVVWTMNPGAEVVRGVSLLEMVCENHAWKLRTLNAEFNSFAYNNDIGGTCTAPSGPAQ